MGEVNRGGEPARPDAIADETLDPERLRAAIKQKDAWWARRVAGPLANRLVGRLAPHPWVTPNRLTLASLLVGIAAAGALATGRQPALAAGALLVQLSFVLDCADGQLARVRGESRLAGALFDRIADRVKLPLIVIGLTGGLWIQSGEGLWILLGFLYYASETVVETCLFAYRRLAGDRARDESERPSLPRGVAFLRVIDLPVIRLGFADRYLLITLFALFGATRPLVVLLVVLGILQAVLRPPYLLAAYRSRFGRWPWQDTRSHDLGELL